MFTTIKALKAKIEELADKIDTLSGRFAYLDGIVQELYTDVAQLRAGYTGNTTLQKQDKEQRRGFH